MVTAEAALALPVLVLVLAGAVAAVAVLGAQLRCTDAAREGVLAAARGEDAATVRSLVEDLAPDGAGVRVQGPDAERVRVTVVAEVTPLGAVPWSVQLRASAVARPEPGVVATP
jgi:Flp pilus assembly protein TadG